MSIPMKAKTRQRALKRDLRAFFSGGHFYIVLSFTRGQKFSYFKALNLCKTESPQSLGAQGLQGFLCNFFLGFSLYYTK